MRLPHHISSHPVLMRTVSYMYKTPTSSRRKLVKPDYCNGDHTVTLHTQSTQCSLVV